MSKRLSNFLEYDNLNTFFDDLSLVFIISRLGFFLSSLSSSLSLYFGSDILNDKFP